MSSNKDKTQLPAKVTEAQFEPVDRHDDNFWTDPKHPAAGESKHAYRPVSFSGRMFNVGWKGWTRLVIICVIVGAIFQAGQFNPFAQDDPATPANEAFTIGAGFGQILNGVINIAGWAAQNGGIPLLLGALAVLPFWLGWRALVTLFNKDRPPGPEDRILPKERQKKKH